MKFFTGQNAPKLWIAGLSLALSLPLTSTALLGTPQAAFAQMVSSPVAGVALPKGAQRVSNGLEAGFGKMLSDGAKEFKLPQGSGGKAEVYYWTGENYKASRAPFMMTTLQSALEADGYTYTAIDGFVDNTPNIFDTEAYGTGELDLGFNDGKPQFFHATNPNKKQTIVGVWISQASQGRMVLALSRVGYAAAAAPTKAPEISDPNVWLVKDLKHATKGMPAPPMPAFPAMAPKKGTVRGMVKDGSGKPLAGAQIIAWASAAGGFRTSFKGKTNAQGMYEIPLPVGICQVVNADCDIVYNGKEYKLPLHPVDGERDEFDSRPGHVENFVLRTSGGTGEKGGSAGSYGGVLRTTCYKIPAGGIMEVTLKPEGPLMDGSKGKTLVFRFKAPKEGLTGEQFMEDIPVGCYTMTAKVYEGEDALPLRMHYIFGDDTETTRAAMKIVWEDKGGTMASLNQSGFQRIDIHLEP